MNEIVQKIATELNVRPAQVEATVRLLDEGASVPFIARYRKEVTGGLDDSQLRQLEVRLQYLRELIERREVILASMEAQGALNETLKQMILDAETKNELEDIYAPYKPKRNSKADKARAAGLEDYADKILREDGEPQDILADFQHEDYPDLRSQLDGIQHIIIDVWSKVTPVTDELRKIFTPTARLKSTLADEEKKEIGKKFRDYFDFSENLQDIPSHRLLALLRGRKENILQLDIEGDDEQAMAFIEDYYGIAQYDVPAQQDFLRQTVKLFWLGKFRPHLENSLLTEARIKAEEEAMKVFAENLRHLLLSSPAGAKVTLGVDPGIRTGVKLAVVNASGDVVEHSTIYPFAPKNDKDGAIAELARLCRDHQVQLIAIGNGTASRETEQLVAEMMAQQSELKLTRVVVSEAGASVYSASELASQELPDLDVSIRGAVSIARRLQDPLAELVKIDPKSIGVGQYQHDVNQVGLAQTLDAVVEDCVNAVGVDVNTASPAILRYIAGLNKNIAQQIVDYRKKNGAFSNRQQLKNVPRLGERTFEQAAGFLRILNGEQPLDASAVHPESYALVETMAQTQGTTVQELMANSEIIHKINAQDYVTEQFGLPTVQDVLRELEKPGRDPRPEFRTAKFREDINDLSQLSEGMQLEGVITNVTNFGAFVDIGVHQDGLVHISELSHQFVSDPHKIVKPGQIVQVRVLQVDEERRRVNLTMKLGSQTATKPHGKTVEQPNKSRVKAKSTKPKAMPQTEKIGGLGALLLQAGIKK